MRAIKATIARDLMSFIDDKFMFTDIDGNIRNKLEFTFNVMLSDKARRDFSVEYKNFFAKCLKDPFLEKNYNPDLPIIDQYKPSELKKAITKLKETRKKLIFETLKYLSSYDMKDNLFIETISDGYDISINIVKDYIKILNLENPELVKEKDYLQKINLKSSIPLIYLLGDRIYNLLSPTIDESSIDINLCYDRILGVDLTTSLVNDVIDYFSKKGIHFDEKHLLRDECVLSKLTELEPNPLLDYYLRSISSTVSTEDLVDETNYEDIYNTTFDYDHKEPFSMKLFWDNFSKIKSDVFSDNIKKYSPRLIKFLVSLQIG